VEREPASGAGEREGRDQTDEGVLGVSARGQGREVGTEPETSGGQGQLKFFVFIERGLRPALIFLRVPFGFAEKFLPQREKPRRAAAAFFIWQEGRG